jgi:hypothetical protein
MGEKHPFKGHLSGPWNLVQPWLITLEDLEYNLKPGGKRRMSQTQTVIIR